MNTGQPTERQVLLNPYFPSWLINFLPFVFLGLMFLLMLGNSIHKGLAYDEHPNLLYGYRFITEGPFAETDGQRMPLLALNSVFCVSYGCDYKTLDSSEWLRFWVRFPSMLFALALGWLLYSFTHCLFGPKAGLFALILYSFNPNFIAHGKQITTDLPTCLFVFWAVYHFWNFERKRKTKSLIFCAISTSLAVLSKYSSVLLFPILALLAGAVAFSQWKKNKLIINVRQIFISVFLFIGIVWSIIQAGYLFQGTFEKSNNYKWKSNEFKKLTTLALPVPFPRTFAKGLDYSAYLQENPSIGRGNNYIMGKRHRKGRWYAFPIMLFLKTPIAFFIFLTWAGFIKTGARYASLYIFIPFSVWFLVFSIFVDVQIGIRYILPAIIFLFIFVGKVADAIDSKLKAVFFVFLSIWYLVSSLSWYPHQLSYFNELIGNRKNAYRYLADSNLDWEDKRYFVDRYKNNHPEMTIRFQETAEPHAGYLIISANEYVGVLDERRSAWLREFSPLEAIAYSHYLFYVSPDALDKALDKHPL